MLKFALGAMGALFVSTAVFAEGMTIYPAQKIITMETNIPEATAVAVADGRIVSVGSLDSLRDYVENHGAVVDERFANKVLMPGCIDPHIHPSLPAVLTQFPFWRRMIGICLPEIFRWPKLMTITSRA